MVRRDAGLTAIPPLSDNLTVPEPGAFCAAVSSPSLSFPQRFRGSVERGTPRMHAAYVGAPGAIVRSRADLLAIVRAEDDQTRIGPQPDDRGGYTHTHIPQRAGARVRRVPEHFIAEMFDGELYASPMPVLPHARATGMLTTRLFARFDFAGPGGWLFLVKPELHLGGGCFAARLRRHSGGGTKATMKRTSNRYSACARWLRPTTLRTRAHSPRRSRNTGAHATFQIGRCPLNGSMIRTRGSPGCPAFCAHAQVERTR